MNGCPSFFCNTNLADRVLRNTNPVFLLEYFPFAKNIYMEQFAQGVHTAYTHSVQTTGNFVRIFIKLTAGVQYGHYHFKGGAAFLGVNTCWNATAIVFHRNGIVFMY